MLVMVLLEEDPVTVLEHTESMVTMPLLAILPLRKPVNLLLRKRDPL